MFRSFSRIALLFCFAAIAAAQTAPPQQSPTTPPSNPKDLASLEGQVTAPGGQPLRKSTLTLRPVGGPGIGAVGIAGAADAARPYQATSDPEGKFIFQGVEPGRYMLQASHPGYLNMSYGAKRATMGGTTLTLTSGQAMKDIRFELMPQAVITGKVLDEDGDPVARAQVMLQQRRYLNGKRQYAGSNSAMTDDNGEFKLPMVAPGRYLLMATPSRNMAMFGENPRTAGGGDATKPEERLVATYYPGSLDPSSAATLDVAAGRDMPGMDIRLKKAVVFRIKGKVSGAIPGENSQRLRVNLMPREPSMMFSFDRSGSIAKDGTFEIDGVQPGSYNLTVMSMQGMLKVFAQQPIDVGNQNIDNAVVGLQPLAELQGAMKLASTPTTQPDPNNPNAKPATDLSGIQVRLNPVDGVSFNAGMAKVKDDGSFSQAEVAPGRYTLNVSGTPDGIYVKSATAGSQDALAGFDVSSGTASVQVTLSPGAADLTGSVQDEKQQPAVGHTVTLIPDPLPPAGQTYLYKQASTDQTGHFTIKNITPGKYRAYAWEDLEYGNQFDPDFMKPLESLGAKLTIDENAHAQVNLTSISTAKASAPH